MAGFPPFLRAAIDAMLEGKSRRLLAERAQATSASYRSGARSDVTIRDGDAAAAYLVARMPATFAAISAALREAAAVVPSFVPTTMLDAACGPGTATFAAAEVWPSLTRATLVDCNPALLAAAAALLRGGPHPTLHEWALQPGRVEAIDALQPPVDLVVLGYGLVEMPPATAQALVETLWRRCSGMMVLVEPGSTEGFGRVRAARAALLQAGARVAAPCPHAEACPMPASDWCHFAERLPRSRDHLIAKGARVPFEDEKYAYAAFVRGAPELPPQARIVRPPRVSKALWTATVCRAGALEAVMVGRQHAAFRTLRKATWGKGIDDVPCGPTETPGRREDI